MRNETTGEPIRWVSPDLTRFDPYWLVEWITWLLERGEEGAAAAVVRRRLDAGGVALEPLVFGSLERLAGAKRLRYHPETTNMYEILPIDEPGQNFTS